VEPIDQTLRGGTQTAGLLFSSGAPLIQEVHAAIRGAVAEYIRDLPQDPLHPMSQRRAGAAAADFDFTGSWSCRLRSQGYHTNHVHPMGWISSAYYARLPQDVEDGARRHGWLKFGESNMALGERDWPASYVKPEVGRLVLFPSFFWHGTVPFADSHDRLSIAFDVVPGGGSRAGDAPTAT
ncbi:MAG TPA: putative 2OG-Fe(II) oxygenase, partial [Nevskia sp.]|nr:putative 2OG-Fe(II) oxygenase [Nevskia sp.]